MGLGPTLSPEQQGAFYRSLYARLEGFDDLHLAVQGQDFESAYKVGRWMLDALRLIQEGVGWEQGGAGPRRLRIPPHELAEMLSRIRIDAVSLCGESHEQGCQHCSPLEDTAIIRDACDQLLSTLAPAARP